MTQSRKWDIWENEIEWECFGIHEINIYLMDSNKCRPNRMRSHLNHSSSSSSYKPSQSVCVENGLEIAKAKSKWHKDPSDWQCFTYVTLFPNGSLMIFILDPKKIMKKKKNRSDTKNEDRVLTTVKKKSEI